MTLLRILISGRERLSVPFRPECADAIATALLRSADDLRAAGRAVALLEAGNVTVIYPFSTMGRLNMDQERKLMPAVAPPFRREMSNCELCGEPMPPGEEMLKFHGYSCECPKPRVPKPPKEVTIPRAKYEALMAAAEALPLVMERYDLRSHGGRTGYEEKVWVLGTKAIAALRAAGIQTEGK